MSFTNTIAQEKVTVTGTKTWVDGGKEHDNAKEITLTLKRTSAKAGSTAQTVEVTPAWTENTYTFSDLDKYDAEGYEYTYTVEEAEIEGYTTKVSDDGLSFTNTIAQEKVTVTGTKTWVDGGKEHNNATEITLTLKRTSAKDGSAAETVTATPAWTENTYTFSDLDKYDAEGYEYTYTVEEAPISGYTTTVSSDGLNFTNTITQIKINIEGTKTWVDGGKEHNNATEITLTLKRTSAKTGSTAETVEATPAWDGNTYTFSDLEKYDAERYEYTYTVEEDEIFGYETTYDGYDITNTLIITEVTVKKAWKNAGDTEPTNAPQGASVTFTLFADDDETDYSVVLDGTPAETAPTAIGGYESEAWTAAFVYLPKYKIVDGEKVAITYTVQETTPWPGYSPDKEEAKDGETITNEQDTVQVVVTKQWDDEGYEKERPESITINLLADKVQLLIAVLDGKVTEEDEFETDPWVATFTSLPKYKINEEGKAEPIKYTVTENHVEGYVTTYDPDEADENAEADEGEPSEPVTSVEEDGEDEEEGSEETVETIEITVINKIARVDLEITKELEKYYDADGDSAEADKHANATFVFEITVPVPGEEEPKYHNYAGITFTGADTKSIVLRGIPYEEGDTITVTEVYTALHTLDSEKTVTAVLDKERNLFTVSFKNTFNNNPPGYGSGIVNSYTDDGKGTPVIKQEAVR